MAVDRADALRDALALVQARLDRDDSGLTVVLDHCDQRAVSSLLADMLACWLRGAFRGWEHEAMARLRDSVQRP